MCHRRRHGHGNRPTRRKRRALSHAFFYGEDQGRYVIASGSADDVLEAAQAAGVPAVLLGYSGGASLVVKGLLSLPLSDIKAAHEAWLPGYMAATE